MSARKIAKALERAGIESVRKQAGCYDTLQLFLGNLDLEARELDDMGREVLRAAAIEQLGEIQGLRSPARLVDAALRGPANKSAGAGSEFKFSDPKPWDRAVDLSLLLGELSRLFERYIFLPQQAAPVLSLWAVFTYCFDSFDISPILAVTSPEKRCGKTTLLELLQCLVRKPLPSSNVTAAAVFRLVESAQPTLLIDEADTFLRKNDDLLGILNSGWRKPSALLSRCVGDQHEVRIFRTWAPKAIASIGLGTLRDTLRDRSIIIRMSRKTKTDKVERFRFEFVQAAAVPFARKMARWVLDNEAALRRADPEPPKAIDDRAQDNWRPLLAIADEAGGVWPDLARQAALELSGGKAAEDDSVRVQLLRDIRERFEAVGSPEALHSQALCDSLAAIEESPWSEWKLGRPITPRHLAALLKPFGVRSCQAWIDGHY